MHRYTAHGSLLYTACDRGVVRRYRRYSDHHGYLGEVFRHAADIQDMDISPYDECILAPEQGWGWRHKKTDRHPNWIFSSRRVVFTSEIKVRVRAIFLPIFGLQKSSIRRCRR